MERPSTCLALITATQTSPTCIVLLLTTKKVHATFYIYIYIQKYNVPYNSHSTRVTHIVPSRKLNVIKKSRQNYLTGVVTDLFERSSVAKFT